MNQFALWHWLENIMHTLEDLSNSCGDIVRYITDFFDAAPAIVRPTFLILLFFAVKGILMSHFLGIYKNRREWKLKPGCKLTCSYFCGSGSFQRMKAYKEAHRLLRDKKWSWVSIAGLSYRLGNCIHDSKLLMFFGSLLYLPMAILGFVEMTLRIVIGIVWLFCASFVHRVLLLVLRLLSCLLIPIWQFADKAARVRQHCPYCYHTFNLPGFKCPYCGTIHEQLVPGSHGILVARCECGRYLPTLHYTGRSHLDAVCPKCTGDLAAANAKQFSVQLIGGNTSGKSAFLAAFQHLYLERSIGIVRFSIFGDPLDAFVELEKMYQSGVTRPSSSSSALTYNLIHKYGRSAKHNLVIYDIPGNAVLNGLHEKNPLNLGFSDGIIILVDPLSIQAVRDQCRKVGDSNAVKDYSHDDIGAIINQFMLQFSEISGRSARKMIDLPVAVLISKADVRVVKQKVGLPKIRATYNANPSAYRNSIAHTRDKICRDYLVDLGIHDALNNLESVFANVHYFSISAIGHISEADKPFEPFGVIDPIAWIARDAEAGFENVLRNAQREDLQ